MKYMITWAERSQGSPVEVALLLFDAPSTLVRRSN